MVILKCSKLDLIKLHNIEWLTIVKLVEEWDLPDAVESVDGFYGYYRGCRAGIGVGFPYDAADGGLY